MFKKILILAALLTTGCRYQKITVNGNASTVIPVYHAQVPISVSLFVDLRKEPKAVIILAE